MNSSKEPEWLEYSEPLSFGQFTLSILVSWHWPECSLALSKLWELQARGQKCIEKQMKKGDKNGEKIDKDKYFHVCYQMTHAISPFLSSDKKIAALQGSTGQDGSFSHVSKYSGDMVGSIKKQMFLHHVGEALEN